MKEKKNIIEWLLEGDISIKYQVHKDILKSDEVLLSSLSSRIATEGFGAKFLKKQNADNTWG